MQYIGLHDYTHYMQYILFPTISAIVRCLPDRYSDGSKQDFLSVPKRSFYGRLIVGRCGQAADKNRFAVDNSGNLQKSLAVFFKRCPAVFFIGQFRGSA